MKFERLEIDILTNILSWQVGARKHDVCNGVRFAALALRREGGEAGAVEHRVRAGRARSMLSMARVRARVRHDRASTYLVFFCKRLPPELNVN